MEKTNISGDADAVCTDSETISPKALGAGIRVFRKKMRLSAKEVAHRLHMPYQNYIYYERRCSATTWERIKDDIARILETTPDEILWISNELRKNSTDPQTAREDAESSLDEDIESLELARRAKARRRALGLAASSVANQIGVSAMTMSSWEKAFPKALTRERAQAWADALNVPTDWLLDPKMDLPNEDIDAPVVIRSGRNRTVSDEIRDIAAWLCRPSRLDRQANWTTVPQRHKANALLFCLRYGTEGDFKTLEQIGLHQGVKKERVRQVCARMTERAEGQSFVTPALDALFADMYEAVPAPLDVLELQFRRILGPNQSLKGAIDFAMEILGRRRFTIQRTNIGNQDGDLLTVTRAGEDAPHLRDVFEVTKRMIRSVGAAQIHMVFGTYSTENPSLSFAEFIHFVKTLPGFEWLSEGSGWYWLGSDTPSENRIITTALKIASVAAQRVDVDAVLAAIDRSRRSNSGSLDDRLEIDVDAPRQIVLKVLIQSGRFELCQYDDVMPVDEISPESILSDAEVKIYRTLKKTGGVSSWSSLKEKVCEDDISFRRTMNVALRRSPIFEHLDFGLYRIIGHSLATTAAMEALQQWRSMHEPSAPPGSLSEETEPVYFDIELKTGILNSGNLDLPPNLVPYILENTPYAIENSHHAVMIKPSRKHGYLRGDGLVRAMSDGGHTAGDSLRIFLFPKDRQFCIERRPSSTAVTIQTDTATSAP